MDYFGKIIDAHGHVYPNKIAYKATLAIADFYQAQMRHVGTVSEILFSGNQIGVRKQLICSTATTPEQVVPINSYIPECCKANNRFIGFATMHPDFLDIEAELYRIKQLGLAGIKLHTDFQQFYIDDPRALLMYKSIAEAHLPILFHMGDDRRRYSEPQQLQRIMGYLPELVAIAAHLGGYQQWDQAVSCLTNIDNLYFDSSSSLHFLSPQAAVQMIEIFGADKVFFGTDFPMWDHKEELSRFMQLPLTDLIREQLLYRNFERVFGI
ncbi:MAG: amidohydrolase family protein [Oscillospiraceae bacterium]|nr:amidohydrolase family protein [Oscillospiraceae bacterium]